MKESRHFYSSLGLLLLLNILIKPVWIFGIDRQVQNVVGFSVYGTYFSLLNFSIVFSFLLDWGFTGFFNRQLAAQRDGFDAVAGKFIYIKLLFVLLYAAVVILAGWLTRVDHWEILIAVIIIQSLTSLFVFLRGIITAKQWFRTDALLSVLDKGLMIVVCSGFFLWPAITGSMTIYSFLWIQVLCSAAAVLTAAVLVFSKAGLFTTRAPVINQSILRQALPFALIVLLMSAHYRLDGFLLERMHPDGAWQAGMYASAYRLLDAGNMIGYLTASFLLPFVARHQNNGPVTEAVTNNSRHLLLVFSIAASVTVFFLADFVQAVLYHAADPYVSTVLQWCLPALIGYSLVQVYGTVMTATGNIVSFCVIVLDSLILNVLLNVLLIPSFGAKGCCIAAVISHGLCGIACMLFTFQKSRLGLNPRSLLIYTFIAAVLAGYFYAGKRVEFNGWILLAGSVVVVIALTIATRLFSLRKWKLYLQQNQ
jgi:O-antigen/teichoic acid export membrane protein